MKSLSNNPWKYRSSGIWYGHQQHVSIISLPVYNCFFPPFFYILCVCVYNLYFVSRSTNYLDQLIIVYPPQFFIGIYICYIFSIPFSFNTELLFISAHGFTPQLLNQVVWWRWTLNMERSLWLRLLLLNQAVWWRHLHVDMAPLLAKGRLRARERKLLLI